MSAPKARLAVVGAGLIGRRHIEHVVSEATLTAVVDPLPSGRILANAHGVPWYAGLSELLAADTPDGVIVAPPNQLHVEQGLACVAAGVPVLIEKPIAADVPSAERLVEAGEIAGVPILVGHHRRYNPLVVRAKAEIAAGSLGRIIAVHVQCWVHKPDDYFDEAWRRAPGAGPILINLVHDVDLLRHLCGSIVSVQSLASNDVRGNEVEDTAGVLLRFANGAIGTMTVSDTVVAPWSWELTAGENPAYPETGSFCYLIGGTDGSLSIPDLGMWRYEGRKSWWEPITRHPLAHLAADPLVLQIRHFAEVALNRAVPLVSGREGLETLKVVMAVREAGRTGLKVRIG